jgi:hypothetical protein
LNLILHLAQEFSGAMFMASKNFIRRLIEAVDTIPSAIWLYLAAAVIGSLVILLGFMD